MLALGDEITDSPGKRNLESEVETLPEVGQMGVKTTGKP